ncbi:hypothetical protein TWF506_004454 [Arthrobotrys conoides]|uniref:Uncharacterized protein n=1 Tax=Arthrobotrys conoides TaxID=74498 RepID=A0AAN8NFS4_9PEZI
MSNGTIYNIGTEVNNAFCHHFSGSWYECYVTCSDRIPSLYIYTPSRLYNKRPYLGYSTSLEIKTHGGKETTGTAAMYSASPVIYPNSTNLTPTKERNNEVRPPEIKKFNNNKFDGVLIICTTLPANNDDTVTIIAISVGITVPLPILH